MRRVRVGVKRKDDDMIVKERIITSFFLGFIFNSTSLFSLQLFQCRVTVWCSFFISLSFFFFYQAWIRGKKEIHERKNKQRMKRHSHGFAKQANTTRFLFLFLWMWDCGLFFFFLLVCFVCAFSFYHLLFFLLYVPFLYYFFPVFYFPVFPLLSSPSPCMCYSTFAVWLLADEWVPCQFMLLCFFFYSC